MRTLRQGMKGEDVRNLQYSAEGNPKALDIQGLIAAAKESIRQMYPDVEE